MVFNPVLVKCYCDVVVVLLLDTSEENYNLLLTIIPFDVTRINMEDQNTSGSLCP